jgi:hypothetical protein
MTMTERVGIIGSRTYPTKTDIVAFIDALPHETVVISGGAHGPDTWAVDAAKARGLTTVIHWPDLPRYGSPSAYFHRNVKIVEGSDRIVAFAAKDPKTKGVTAGTTMTIGIAERANVPVEIIATPVPALLCDCIAKLRGRYDNIRLAGTPGERDARVRSAWSYVTTLIAARDDYEVRLGDGWEEVEEAANDVERQRLESLWLKFECIYRTLADTIVEAYEVAGL